MRRPYMAMCLAVAVMLCSPFLTAIFVFLTFADFDDEPARERAEA